jgi:hypothetical protein
MTMMAKVEEYLAILLTTETKSSEILSDLFESQRIQEIFGIATGNFELERRGDAQTHQEHSVFMQRRFSFSFCMRVCLNVQ